MLETLTTIKKDLDNTADQLERLPAAMVGYTLFSAAKSAPGEVADIIASLHGIEESIRRLRGASAKISHDLTAPPSPDSDPER